MKKISFLIFIVIFFVSLSACVKDREPQVIDEPQDEISTISISERCEANEGAWLEDFQECEFISEDWCLENEGIFNECESACRHTNDEICILMCVPVCIF